MATELPELLVGDAAALRVWLSEHHQTSAGVRLVLGRKGGDVTALTWDAAVDEGICFGWIDSQAGKRDEASWTVRFTPRTARSRWSKKNVDRVERLEAEGRMTEAGRAEVASARADGRWDAAYEGPAKAVVPDDLAEAVAENPAAQEMFEVLTSQNRFHMIGRLGSIKTEATRQRVIGEFVAMLARHETPYPQKRRPV